MTREPAIDQPAPKTVRRGVRTTSVPAPEAVSREAASPKAASPVSAPVARPAVKTPAAKPRKAPQREAVAPEQDASGAQALARRARTFPIILAAVMLAMTAALAPTSMHPVSLGVFGLAALLLALPAFQLLAAMHFTLPEPEARLLTPADAADLYDAVEEARAKIGASMVDGIYLDHRLTAEIRERPTRGAFGRWRRDLVVGLPLLFALSPAELAALVGGELSRAAGPRADLNRTILLLRHTQARLSTMPLAFVARLIVAHLSTAHVPKLEAAAATLARDEARDADRAMAESAGAPSAGSALVRLEIAKRFLTAIGTEYDAANITGERPEMLFFTLMSETLPSAVSWGDAETALDAALASKAVASLAKRLAALPAAERMPAELLQDASHLLGDARADIIADCDEVWWEDHAVLWAAHGERNGRLAVLEDLAAQYCAAEIPMPDAAADDDMPAAAVA